MKADSQIRATIIGLGNLMEIVFPHIRAVMGTGLAQRLNATTADAADLPRKEKAFGIPIILNDNARALAEMEPDIIFFAPPPTAAPALVKGPLKDHFAARREAGRPLPEVYAFPPVPAGDFYLETLGRDARVINLIPSNIARVAGLELKGEGLCFHTPATPWPAPQLARVLRFFAAECTPVELARGELIPMLGALCVINSLWAALPLLAADLSAAGHGTGHNQLAEYLRARLQERLGFRPALSRPCSTDALGGPGGGILDGFALAWPDGLRDYFANADFPADKGEIIISRALDLNLHVTQAEPAEVVHHHAVAAATKGGVLEKAIACYHEFILDHVRLALAALPASPSPAWAGQLRGLVGRAAEMVRQHGHKLAG